MSKEQPELEPLTKQLAARFGLEPDDGPTREERRSKDAHKHYIGFDNATLLTYEDNKGKVMYTNGIRGCNALVLSSMEGTYMAHINVEILNKAPVGEIANNIKDTLAEFERTIGQKPSAAHLIGDEIINRELHDTLVKEGIVPKLHQAMQYGIRVGDVAGNEKPYLNSNSNFNEINKECNEKNLLSSRLQWPIAIPQRRVQHTTTLEIEEKRNNDRPPKGEGRDYNPPPRERDFESSWRSQQTPQRKEDTDYNPPPKARDLNASWRSQQTSSSSLPLPPVTLAPHLKEKRDKDSSLPEKELSQIKLNENQQSSELTQRVPIARNLPLRDRALVSPEIQGTLSGNMVHKPNNDVRNRSPSSTPKVIQKTNSDISK